MNTPGTDTDDGSGTEDTSSDLGAGRPALILLLAVGGTVLLGSAVLSAGAVRLIRLLGVLLVAALLVASLLVASLLVSALLLVATLLLVSAGLDVALLLVTTGAAVALLVAALVGRDVAVAVLVVVAGKLALDVVEEAHCVEVEDKVECGWEGRGECAYVASGVGFGEGQGEQRARRTQHSNQTSDVRWPG